MNGYNENITDRELRELLKSRLLKGGDDSLTQKLIDMEAQIAFGNTPHIVPSPARENQLMQSTGRSSLWIKLLKWIIPALIAIAGIVIFASIENDDKPQPAHQRISGPAPVNDEQPLTAIDTPDEDRPVITNKKSTPLVTGDSTAPQPSVQPYNADHSPELASKSRLPRYEHDEADAGNVPALTRKDIEENNRFKEKMLKQLIKKDSRQWIYIPMGSTKYKGDTVSVQSFYMSATEVTNKQYRTLLYDLLSQGRVDDYLEAVPDSSQWGKLYQALEPLTQHYHSHPAYDNYPVVNISREAAEMYCVWLSREAYSKLQADYGGGKSRASYQINDVRLPFDIEWAVAARGGKNSSPYPWGGPDIQNSKGCYLANFNIQKNTCKLKPVSECANSSAPSLTSAGAAMGGIGVTTAPVSSYNPDHYGLYNMSGNAAEMVQVFNKANPAEKRPGTKGGSWFSDCEHVKIEADDEHEGVVQPSPYIGFRPVMTFTGNGGR